MPIAGVCFMMLLEVFRPPEGRVNETEDGVSCGGGGLCTVYLSRLVSPCVARGLVS